MARPEISIVALGTLALALTLAPQRAEACGGTFCDALPFNPMPVDQRGEEILFVVEGGMVEVHIRIAYEGNAERFAWIVPLQGIPEVSIGSEAMFSWLYPTTIPDWWKSTSYDCPEDNPDWGDTNTGDGDGDGGDGDGDGGPQIVLQEQVGAFEVLVLQGGTAAEVIDFLAMNDYEQDPQAEPILQEYLDEGFLFAAIKLTASADVDEIHPLVFQFPGDEPCVPIRLTSIAAKDDMDIRAYFLGDLAWVPSNYRHVVLNPLALNWSYPSPNNYEDLLGAAIDEAGGQGFVTEFYHPLGGVPTSVSDPNWNPAAFIGIDPATALVLVVQQGLNQHPLIQSLLMEFIPPPPNVDPLDFWNNPDFYAGQFDLVAWGDGSGFAAALDERIVQPGLHVDELVMQWPMLTALHTKMSPAEMTLDPTFHTVAEPPFTGSSNVHVVEQVLCGGTDRIFHIPVGLQEFPVCVPDNAQFPTWEMPAAMRIEQVPMVGPPQVITDNLPVITDIYDAHEASNICVAGDGDGDGGPDGGTEADGSTGPAQDESNSTGCGCSASGGASVGLGLGGLALGLLGLGLLRRRRE